MRAPSGKTNPFSVLIFIGLVLAGWWGFYYFPIWLDSLDVSEYAEGATAVAITDTPEIAKGNLIRRLNGQYNGSPPPGYHFEVDEETGVEKRVPGLGVTEDDVTVEVDPNTKSIHVHLEYNRTVILAPLEKRRTTHYVVDKRSKYQ